MKDLISAVRCRKEAEAMLKTATAGAKAALEVAKGQLPELVKGWKRAEEQLREHYTTAYHQAHQERLRLLLKGEEVPAIPLPEGISVKWDQTLVGDPDVDWSPELIAEFMTVNRAAVKKALESGREVPGFELEATPTLIVRTK